MTTISHPGMNSRATFFRPSGFGILLLALALPAAAANLLELDAAALERAGVVTAPVEEHDFSDRVRVVGQVVRSPGGTIEVKTILAGRVEEIHVAPGQTVEKDQKLLTIHSHALHEMLGELLQASKALKLAETRVEAGKELYALEGISRLELERREQEALAARLARSTIEAELEDLGYTEAEIEMLRDKAAPHPILHIRAPAAGVVLDLEVETHAWLQPYEPLVVIGHPRDLELHLQIPPGEAARVRRGDEVVFEPVGRPGVVGRARVITPVPQIDPTTRTVTIRAELLDGKEELLPGLFVEGTLACGEAAPALALPEAAITRLESADYAFVRRGTTSFEARKLELGRFDGSRYEVRSGLEAGEEVAVKGVFLLKSALLQEGGGE